MQTFEQRVVDGKTYVDRFEEACLSFESGSLWYDKLFLRNRARNLSCAVGTEIEAYNTVAVLNKSDGFAVFENFRRLYKLVRNVRRIAVFNGFYGV